MPQKITQEMQDAITLLGLQGEALSDLEKTRIATFNRIGALQRLGLTDSPVLETANAIGDGLIMLEKQAKKDLVAALKGLGPAIYEFVQEARGVGEPQAARLLAVIGHPCWRYDNHEESPTYGKWLTRTVGQLWSYCGYAVDDGEAPRRKKGERSHFNTAARMRAYLIAESCIKAVATPTRPQGHYRDEYDAARIKYKDAVHTKHPCPRCGPKGKPAQPGSILSDGHQHSRALRLVAKEMLKDLWVAGQEG